MRISDWSSDVCSSDLPLHLLSRDEFRQRRLVLRELGAGDGVRRAGDGPASIAQGEADGLCPDIQSDQPPAGRQHRSEEHTSELQSLMRISYAVFCLKKKKTTIHEYN